MYVTMVSACAGDRGESSPEQMTFHGATPYLYLHCSAQVNGRCCWLLVAGLATYRLRLRTSIRPRLYPLFIVYHTTLLNGLPVSHGPWVQSDVVGLIAIRK